MYQCSNFSCFPSNCCSPPACCENYNSFGCSNFCTQYDDSCNSCPQIYDPYRICVPCDSCKVYDPFDLYTQSKMSRAYKSQSHKQTPNFRKGLLPKPVYNSKAINASRDRKDGKKRLLALAKVMSSLRRNPGSKLLRASEKSKLENKLEPLKINYASAGRRSPAGCTSPSNSGTSILDTGSIEPCSDATDNSHCSMHRPKNNKNFIFNETSIIDPRRNWPSSSITENSQCNIDKTKNSKNSFCCVIVLTQDIQKWYNCPIKLGLLLNDYFEYISRGKKADLCSKESENSEEVHQCCCISNYCHMN